MPAESGGDREGILAKESGSFLGRHLSNLDIGDPFMVKNSDEVCMFVSQSGAAALNAFFLDAKYLFYSLQHKRLLEFADFHNNAGISVAGFFYL